MTKEHYNELIELSHEIYSQAADTLANYCAAKYCGISNNTTVQQLQDYILVAQETTAWFLGNALALLTPDSQEKEIEILIRNIRRTIHEAQKQIGGDLPPS